MYLAIHIPDFAVAAVLRFSPDPISRPFAVLDGKGRGEIQEKLPILAINDRAREAGIEKGCPLNRALVRCPDLKVFPRNVPAEAVLCDDLVRMAELLGPDVEITRSDVVILDLSTRRHPLGHILNALELDNCSLWHAQAPTPDLAHMAATHASTAGKVITPQELASLPLEILATDGFLFGEYFDAGREAARNPDPPNFVRRQ